MPLRLTFARIQIARSSDGFWDQGAPQVSKDETGKANLETEVIEER